MKFLVTFSFGSSADFYPEEDKSFHRRGARIYYLPKNTWKDTIFRKKSFKTYYFGRSGEVRKVSRSMLGAEDCSSVMLDALADPKKLFFFANEEFLRFSLQS